MLLAVTDCETSGLEETDQIVELAIVTLSDKGKQKSQWSTLIRPSCPISLGARATHHITDAELADAPSVTEMLLSRGLPEFGRPPNGLSNLAKANDIVLVAHNAEFDRRMLVQSGIHPDLLPRRTICTYKVSLHMFPDAPGHSNQVLRYYLGVEPPKCDLPPHRALPDALVTAAILSHMLQLDTAERLVELTSTPVLLKKVHFGQHRGKLWSELDSGMLQWVLKKKFDEDVMHTARYHLNARQGRVL